MLKTFLLSISIVASAYALTAQEFQKQQMQAFEQKKRSSAFIKNRKRKRSKLTKKHK